MQNVTQALKSVKCTGNIFDLNPKWKELCCPLAILHGIYIAPFPKSKYLGWYLTPCCGLEVQNPIQTLKSVKGPSNGFDLNPKSERTFPSFGNFSWHIYSPLQSNPTQPLNPVNSPGNILETNPKWERILSCFGNCSWNIHSAPNKNPNIKVDIWHPAVSLRCRIPPWHLNQLKTREMPLTGIPSEKELCVLWEFFMGYL